ncbi:hypothetical protein ACEN4P_00915 [Marinilactibacillus psychrotolerans]|uniref:hypothetical protein n=1 Tax=Marinilactibacillus psychrotolerans TaxID=191770 RepID=UPI001C7DFDA5|nr:hypothetical protein [Marinilactibacillus psychrotolerans]GEQ33363.1 hypothetical protein B795N_12450 [Marinilactibacillus psychrotolerans]
MNMINEDSLHYQLGELEDTLNKLKSWEQGLEFIGDYYSTHNPDLERLVEEYTPTSAIFWAFQRDFSRLNKEAEERFDQLSYKYTQLKKELESKKA